IDGSIVNVALPAIERDLGGGLPAQQWVSNAYLLTLGSLILIGGSLGDIYGARRVFAIGVAAFGALSVACAAAPSIGWLIATRARIVDRAIDLPGAILCASGLGGLVFGLIEEPRYGWTSPAILVPLLGGVLTFAAFLFYERRAEQPMLELDLFRRRNFAVGNL